MKAYTYQASEVGLKRWPEGELQLADIIPVTDPREADIFICPGPLSLFQKPDDLATRFPHMNPSTEERHVFFDVSDFTTIYPGNRSILIRCNLKRAMQKANSNAIPWAWPVDDFSECIPIPEDGFKFDVSFQGWVWSDARKMAVDACRHDARLSKDIAGYPDFCGYIYDTPEGLRRRREFRRSMRESRIALCPESIAGVFPYRFFEAMSAGRIPLLVGSNYCLPFADEIPYARFGLFIESEAASRAAHVIYEFVRKHSDAEIVQIGIQARQYWERFLNREDWPKTMRYAVDKKFKELGLAVGA